MKVINIPKDGASDNKVRLVNILKNDGQKVLIGDILCEFETSKTIIEIRSDAAGYIYFLYIENSEIPVNSPVCIISDSLINENDIKTVKEKYIKNKKSFSGKIISKKAQELIDKNNIDIKLIHNEVISEKLIKDYLFKIQSKQESSYSFRGNDIAIYGIGGHAGMCIDIILKNKKYNLVGFIDDRIKTDSVYKLPFLGEINQLDNLIDSGLKNIIIGIGFLNNLKKREEVFDLFDSKLNIPSIIHPSAIIEKTAQIKKGCQIMAGSIIGSNAIIGKNSIINCGAIVSHNTFIDNSSHITPGATIAGHVKIGKRVTIGMCSTIFIGLSISNDTIINNNERILKSI